MYSEKLKEIRKKLKLSQEEMAFQTGTSYRAYSSYERGDRKPSFEFLGQLVEKYNVNLNSLIADKGPLFFNESESRMININDLKDEIMSNVREMLVHEGVLK